MAAPRLQLIDATVNLTVQEFIPSSLAGFVYFDVDNDGIKDAGEAAIAGVQEINIAVIGCTATLLLAFVPIMALPEGAGAFVLAEALRQQGSLTDAVAHYREALRHNPGCWQACNNLALTLGKLGNAEAAHRFLQEAFRLRQRAGISGR